MTIADLKAELERALQQGAAETDEVLVGSLEYLRPTRVTVRKDSTVCIQVEEI
jgi:hypothetical protein